ncbi:MAG: T9SS type A sorting domain-containing protein [Candidatus Eisenbacteria bacterium]|uniref:T9SS type A sorting domain-containing protein n=1 Tax=Eiseniibacteriota bacterium TaxID=2212470 RepID=A0A538TXG7_UNCEI|nr:MAG: T9SS type A sorting domain-containing protein [Candidatus Eisenbacteria bacterium]
MVATLRTRPSPTTFFAGIWPTVAPSSIPSPTNDRRFLLPSGPFTLAPGESLVVVAAIVVGDGTDRLSSIAKLRDYDDEVQRLFDNPGCQIAMSFTLTPRALSLRSLGHWVTGYLEPPGPWTPDQIDVASVRLNGTVPVDGAAPITIGDFNGNGIADLALKFDRAAVELQLVAGDSVPISLSGTVAGQCFTGRDTIRVLRAAVTPPAAGKVLSPGITTVRWEIPAGVDIESVALLRSFDDGANWQLAASGLPNSGSYDWNVPAFTTHQARVAVVVVESSDERDYVVDGVLGVSGMFSIQGVTGVTPVKKAEFALRGVTPNPARDVVRVSFSLPDDRAATLELFDVSGRQLATRRVGGTGVGWRVVEFGGRGKLPAGVYIIRLTQGGQSLTTRAALVR